MTICGKWKDGGKLQVLQVDARCCAARFRVAIPEKISRADAFGLSVKEACVLSSMSFTIQIIQIVCCTSCDTSRVRLTNID